MDPVRKAGGWVGLVLAFAVGAALAAPAVGRAKLQCTSGPRPQQLVLKLVSATRDGVPLEIPADVGESVLMNSASYGGEAFVNAYEADSETPVAWGVSGPRPLRRTP